MTGGAASERVAGFSILGLITGVALLVVAGVTMFVTWAHGRAESRDEARRQELKAIAAAQEYHFDRLRRYGSLDELVNMKLLNAIPHDPGTGLEFQLYRTASADEWCTWARLETGVNAYLTQDGYQVRNTSQLPTNLATCKN